MSGGKEEKDTGISSSARQRRRRSPRRFTFSMQKRLLAMFALIVAAFVVLAVRLFLIQRDNGRSYTMQVLSQQAYGSKTLPYKRGRIVDSKGTVLADSQLVYNVIIDARQMLEDKAYLEPSLDAAARLGIDKEKLRAYVTENSSSQYYIARRNLPYQDRRAFDTELKEGIEAENKAAKAVQAAKKAAEEAGEDPEKIDPVEFVYNNIKGIWFEEAYIRTYPCSTLAADVIGFSGTANKGSYGLEEYYNDTLNGVEGRTYGYLDESLNVEQTTIQPKDGNNLILTLDANLQSICEKYLKEFNAEFKNKKHKGNGSNNAACIIMDPHTGGILAMASEPGFDPNNPYDISAVTGMPKLNKKDTPTTSYLTLAETRTMSDKDKARYLSALWNNFCVSTHFEPGSTAKPFTTAMGLETGKVKTTDKYECTGQLIIDGTRVPCAHLEGDGVIDPAGAIERSCNVALMQEAEKIGPEIFCKYQNVFNFGLKTNVDLANEARTDGYLYAQEDMKAIDLATNSFGQNFEVTMIQMITGFCSLINGGYYYQPHIVDRITSAGGSTVQTNEPRVLKKTVSEETSALIRQYCIRAVEGEHATGPLARPAGYRIGGKTGTAETLPRENGQWIVSFMGFAPAEDPQIVIYVVLDRINNKKQDEAGRACEIARKILSEALPYLNIYMTEPLSYMEQAELEKMGLYDTNDRVQQTDQEGQ
ncbi:MAG: penicillin-binding protein 2 [Eubacteriales bacterium]|nr:penicillin-binding protein 2 [Eubacteriales bacterium]